MADPLQAVKVSCEDLLSLAVVEWLLLNYSDKQELHHDK